MSGNYEGSCSEAVPNTDSSQLSEPGRSQESWFSSVTSSCQARVRTALDTLMVTKEKCVTAPREELEFAAEAKQCRAEVLEQTRQFEEYGDSSAKLTEGPTRPTSSQLPASEEIASFREAESVANTEYGNPETDMIISDLRPSIAVPISPVRERSTRGKSPWAHRASSVTRSFKAAQKLGGKWLDRFSRSLIMQDVRDAWTEADFSDAPRGATLRGRQQLPPLPRGASFRPQRGPLAKPDNVEVQGLASTPAAITPRRRFKLARGRTVEMSHQSSTEFDDPTDADSSFQRPPSAGWQLRQKMQSSHHLASAAVVRMVQSKGEAKPDPCPHVDVSSPSPEAAKTTGENCGAHSPARETAGEHLAMVEEATQRNAAESPVGEGDRSCEKDAAKPPSDGGSSDSFSYDAIEEGSVDFTISLGRCSSIGSTMESDAGESIVEAMVVSQVLGGMDLTQSTIGRAIPSGLSGPRVPVSNIRDADVKKALRAGIGGTEARHPRPCRAPTASSVFSRRSEPRVFIGKFEDTGPNCKTRTELFSLVRKRLESGTSEVDQTLKSTIRGVEKKEGQNTLHSKFSNLAGAILLIEPCIIAGVGVNRESVAKAIAGEVNKYASTDVSLSRKPPDGGRDLHLVIFEALGVSQINTSAEFFAAHIMDATWNRVIPNNEPQSMLYSGSTHPLQMWGIWQSLHQLAPATQDVPANCEAVFVGSCLVLLALRELDEHTRLIVDAQPSDALTKARPKSGIAGAYRGGHEPAPAEGIRHRSSTAISLLSRQAEESLRASFLPLDLTRHVCDKNISPQEEFKHMQNLVLVEPSEHGRASDHINQERFRVLRQYISKAAESRSPGRRRLGQEIATLAWEKYRDDPVTGRVWKETLELFPEKDSDPGTGCSKMQPNA